MAQNKNYRCLLKIKKEFQSYRFVHTIRLHCFEPYSMYEEYVHEASPRVYLYVNRFPLQSNPELYNLTDRQTCGWYIVHRVYITEYYTGR